ncbi:MAG: flippase-like domain-containing protein [Bacteroidetes bacterium]|nr:flippase-like domain-containing protein [Bacteroidota bacterium]
MKKLLQNILKVLVFFGIGLGILYLVYLDQDAAWQAQCALDGVPESECSLIGKILDDFASAKYFWLFLVLVAFSISNISRAARWLMLLRPLGYKPSMVNGFFTIMLGYFANLGFPRIGEVIRAGTFARYEKIPAEKVFGTVVVDRIADVIVFAAVLGVTFIIEFDRILELLQSFRAAEDAASSGISLFGWIIRGVLGFSLLALLLLVIFWKRIKAGKLYKKVQEIVIGFIDGLKTISKLEKPGWFIFHSLNIWFMYYLMTYLGFYAFAPTAELGAMPALMVFAVGALGILIPSPGGMGTYHALVSACLVSMYGLAKADAFSFANILFFSIQLGCNILLGLLALVVLPVYNRNRNPVIPETVEE